MKKLSLLFLTTLLAFSAFSQVRIGLRVAPGLCINRVYDSKSTDGFTVDNNGSGVRFTLGPNFDFGFGNNYAFATGLWYTSSRAGLSYTDQGTGIKNTEVVSLQAVQIPLTFKVNTNEITTDVKLYFQLGGLATFNFNEKFKESSVSGFSSDNYVKKYSPVDFSIYMGAGVKYKIGETNELFAGFFYNRGLPNILRNVEKNNINYNYKDEARYNMDQVGIEVGVIF